jgi:hypothetical protein
MTREELREQIEQQLSAVDVHYSHQGPTADAVIRLVVEACANSLRQRFSNASEKWFAAETSDHLHSIFLPPKDLSNG